ncbi:MAG TPA: glycoside hydrolase family 99-like domain-containing protein [Flavitalea sp.]|nr:glycoside hydrolase family 99-like domain-containing protein [Flavitalea sp.]
MLMTEMFNGRVKSHFTSTKYYMHQKITLAVAFFMFFIFCATAQNTHLVKTDNKNEYEVAVYYFPNYHPDSIDTRWHGKGWTEWDVVKSARPRFKGHEQPKVPTWGYFNEADPKWAAKEIDLAADNNIDCFIYDWYWYSNTGQYLQEGLEQGFLKAPNRNRLKFALMWANHDWLNIHPATYDKSRISLTQGEISKELWDTISTYIVEKYFKEPNYWKIDGKPYFSIYEIITFINGLGGIGEAKKAIQLLDEKTKKAGFPGVHFNVMSWMVNDNMVKTISGPSGPADAKEMLKNLNTESVSTYCYLHHYTTSQKDGFPTIPVEKPFAESKAYWHKFIKDFPDVLYTPNISMGWDASPRCMQSDKFEMGDYPWTPVFTGNTPASFQMQLQEAKKFLDTYNPKHKIVVLNSWNEWTEGSYLLPEKKYGDAYLKAIKSVFKRP